MDIRQSCARTNRHLFQLLTSARQERCANMHSFQELCANMHSLQEQSANMHSFSPFFCAKITAGGCQQGGGTVQIDKLAHQEKPSGKKTGQCKKDEEARHEPLIKTF